MTTKTQRPGAAKTAGREAKTTSAPAPETAPGDVLREALELATKQREQDAAKQQAATAARWQEYLTLLTRADKPGKDDAKRLSELMVALEIDAAQVEADLGLLRKYIRLRGQHEALDSLRAKEREAREQFHALERRQREELAEAARAASMAAHEARDANTACFEALRLHLARPEFFEGEPVALHKSGNAKFPTLLSSTPGL